MDLLDRHKEGRCIVLTTHDLNEADAVADRIAILCRGALQIYGTALHLKSVCGVGYTLNFTVDCSHCDAAMLRKRVDTLSRTVSDFVDNATLFDAQNVHDAVDRFGGGMLSAPSLEVVFKTAISDSSRFPLLFEHIDARRSTLHIASYAVSVTTMEEVFLSIAGGHCSPSTTTTTTEHLEMDDDLVRTLLELKRPTLSPFELSLSLSDFSFFVRRPCVCRVSDL